MLDAIIGAWTSGFVLDVLEPMLQERDVPASRVFTMADIFSDPHFAARGSIVHAPDADLGSIAKPAPAPRLSATPGAVIHAGGAIGADTVDVLGRVAGLTSTEIDALLASGAAFDAAHARPRTNPLMVNPA